MLGDRPNQIDRQRDDVAVDRRRPARRRGDAGRGHRGRACATTSRVGIQYLAAWLRGAGAVAINNLMEDAATAEISRSQIWQWLHHGRVERADVVRRSPTRRCAKLGADGYDEARGALRAGRARPTTSSSS